MASTTVPAPVRPRLLPASTWVLLAQVWHGVLGVGLVVLGVALLVGVTDSVVPVSNFLVRAILFIVCLALGGVQLLYWSGLRAHRSRSRVMSLAINFSGFLLLLFITFRQMTCVNVCEASPVILAADRLALWLPFLVATLAFGLMAYGLWRRDVAELFGETPHLRTALTAYLYISPYLLTVTVFTVGLLIYAFLLSFTSYSDANLYGGQPPTWVGLDNYGEALQDSEFLVSISNVIWYAIIVVIFQTIISLGLALMMNARFGGRRMFRTLFYAPSVTASVVISLIFLWLFNGQGIVNYVLYDLLQLADPLRNLGLRTPNTNWLNTPTRLGDLLYLKPFFDGSWIALLAIPLFVLALMMLVRVSLWVRDHALNRRAILFAGVGATATAIVLTLLLGLLPGASPGEGEAAATTGSIQGAMVLKVLLISLGLGLVGGLVVNFLELEEDLDTITRSAVLGVALAVLLAIPLILLFGAIAIPEAFAPAAEAHVSIFTLLVLPLVAGPIMAGFTANLSHRLFLPQEEGTPHMLKPQPGGNMARRLDRWVSWVGTGLLAVLGIWCVLVVLAAAATTGVTQATDLGDRTFGVLLLRGPSVAFMVIMLLNIFTTSPTFMIMFLAALQDIPSQLYEAAQIDGASRWQQFWNVTLPMLRPVMLLIVVLGTIGTFQVFDQVHVMTSGGPLNTTLTPVYLIFTKTIGDQRAAEQGYAAAMAFILAAIIFVITYVQRNYIERGTERY